MVDVELAQVVLAERMVLNIMIRMGCVMVVPTVIVAFVGLG